MTKAEFCKEHGVLGRTWMQDDMRTNWDICADREWFFTYLRRVATDAEVLSIMVKKANADSGCHIKEASSMVNSREVRRAGNDSFLIRCLHFSYGENKETCINMLRCSDISIEEIRKYYRPFDNGDTVGDIYGRCCPEGQEWLDSYARGVPIKDIWNHCIKVEWLFWYGITFLGWDTEHVLSRLRFDQEDRIYREIARLLKIQGPDVHMVAEVIEKNGLMTLDEIRDLWL